MKTIMDEEEVIKRALKRVLGAHAVDAPDGSVSVSRIDYWHDRSDPIAEPGSSRQAVVLRFVEGLLSSVELVRE